jgi:hypothetical protein
MTRPEKTAEKRGDDEPGEVSQGPSGFGHSEAALGGADAVPGTPDATPSTATGDQAERES